MRKIAADHFSTTRVLATGSSTLGASTRFRDTLAGRKIDLWLTPMIEAVSPTASATPASTGAVAGDHEIGGARLQDYGPQPKVRRRGDEVAFAAVHLRQPGLAGARQVQRIGGAQENVRRQRRHATRLGLDE